MNNMFELARKTIKDFNEKDKNNMPLIYNSCSNDEKIFIDVFMKKLNKYKNKIIYNKKSGCINFCYDNMQVGRIRLDNKKRRMQILTKYGVEWKENINLHEAIDNIDKWYNYLEQIIKE